MIEYLRHVKRYNSLSEYQGRNDQLKKKILNVPKTGKGEGGATMWLESQRHTYTHNLHTNIRL